MSQLGYLRLAIVGNTVSTNTKSILGTLIYVYAIAPFIASFVDILNLATKANTARNAIAKNTVTTARRMTKILL